MDIIEAKVLHDIIQAVMGWFDYHFWEFTIGKQRDFCDCWEHRLTVTNGRAGEPSSSYPRYIGGEQNGPPEDCGGIPGFSGLLEALADPKHPDHADAREWVGDDNDPDTFDELQNKYALSRIANRRNAARSRLANKQTLGSAA